MSWYLYDVNDLKCFFLQNLLPNIPVANSEMSCSRSYHAILWQFIAVMDIIKTKFAVDLSIYVFV